MFDSKKYYINNREKIIERNKQWREKHPEYSKKYMKCWRKDNPEKQRKGQKRWKLKQYELTYEDWVKMWVGQDGECAICRESFIEHSDAHVDHNHETGEVRGLLCIKCNTAIGFFNDDPKLIAKAIEYLGKEKK